MNILPDDITQTHKCYEQVCVYKTTVVHLTWTSSQITSGDHFMGEFLKDLIVSTLEGHDYVIATIN